MPSEARWRCPPGEPGAFPTLGFQVADWIEARCAIPDREFAGEPFLLTDEQLAFLLYFYRLDPVTGGFVYHRGAQLTRPQKWGKAPLSAAIICAEAQGPVRFSHWDSDHRDGVVAKPVSTPLIQVTAVSEDQADNIYSALLPMIELGALRGEIDDTGLGRINLPGGGRITPVTASARSRLGQRVTFSVEDQTESWLESNGGRKLADNQRRNIAGMGGRWLSTPNAWDPTEESVAQYTAEFEHEGVYHDDATPSESLSIRNKRERRKALRLAYGDAVTGCRNGKAGAIDPWIDLDRIDAEILALLPRDPAQAERWFLNRKQAGEAKAFRGAVWDKLGLEVSTPEGSFIVVGVDGARFVDALGLIATDIESGFQWPLGIWERPPAPPDGYEHPFDQVDGAMLDAFDDFDIWRVYVDPQWIDHLLEKWQGRWGKKRVLAWLTNRPHQMAHAVRGYTDAIGAGDLSHNGDPVFTRHIKNAVKQKVNVYDDDHRQMHTLSKDRPDSPRKIDGAVAGVLSWEARGDAIAGGAEPRSRRAGGLN
ncbi:MAG: hypothetical protein ACRDNE_00575 [Gaiellaceae bacterium]